MQSPPRALPRRGSRLLKQQEAISKATEQAMADGKLTQEEKLELRMMQAQADFNIYQASHNGQRDIGARFDSTAQTQADQIDRIANGRSNGNITASEATELLDQQEQIADARGDLSGWAEDLLVGFMQEQADSDIRLESLPGDQSKWDDWGNIFPRPLPVTPMLRKGVILP